MSSNLYVLRNNMKLSSYKRQQQKIAYLEQRGEQLEEMLFSILKHNKKIGNVVSIPLNAGGRSLCGDKLITDITTGEFTMRLIQEI